LNCKHPNITRLFYCGVLVSTDDSSIASADAPQPAPSPRARRRAIFVRSKASKGPTSPVFKYAQFPPPSSRGKREERFAKSLDELTKTLDKFLKRLSDMEEEFVFMKEDLKRVKAVLREKLGVSLD
jgi:hypothetical protein